MASLKRASLRSQPACVLPLGSRYNRLGVLEDMELGEAAIAWLEGATARRGPAAVFFGPPRQQ